MTGAAFGVARKLNADHFGVGGFDRFIGGWNEDNRAAGRPQAQPVYLTDDASGNLYIQSGRADIFFGPQSVAAYKAALNGQTRVVGLGPKKAWVATTTKKRQRSGLCPAGSPRRGDCPR